MEDYKQVNMQAYDLNVDQCDVKFADHFEELVKEKAKYFVDQLGDKKILDVGCGPGNHAEWFAEQGLDVTCVDISPNMVARCKQKGLNADVGDVEELDYEDATFDGVWMYAVLLHVPREKASLIVEEAARLLKINGILGICTKEGEGEGYQTHPKYKQFKRFVSYFSDEEVRSLFSPHFEILKSWRTVTHGSTGSIFLHYTMRKTCD